MVCIFVLLLQRGIVRDGFVAVVVVCIVIGFCVGFFGWFACFVVVAVIGVVLLVKELIFFFDFQSSGIIRFLCIGFFVLNVFVKNLIYM